MRNLHRLFLTGVCAMLLVAASAFIAIYMVAEACR